MSINKNLGMSSMFLLNNSNPWGSSQVANGYDSSNFGGISANMFDRPAHTSMTASAPSFSYQNQFATQLPHHESGNGHGQQVASMMNTASVFNHQNTGSSSTSMVNTSPAHFPLIGDATGLTGIPGIDDGFVIPELNINVPIASIEDSKDELMSGVEGSSDDNRTITAPVTPF
jgi:hypothetical protein